MKKILIIISFFLLFCSKTYAETVKEIIVSGNKRVSEETIKVYGEIEINKDYQDSDLNNIVRNLFSTDFFEDVNVTLNNNVLKINVKEYPVINQLVFVGEKSNRYIEQIKKSIKLKQKGSFIKSKLAKDIETIKTLYSSLGYNFSKIEPKIKQIDSNNLDLVIFIERGNLTKISNIKFVGDKKIRDSRFRDIIASEEDKFWKFISKNT